jgi:hypothetical protein
MLPALYRRMFLIERDVCRILCTTLLNRYSERLFIEPPGISVLFKKKATAAFNECS